MSRWVDQLHVMNSRGSISSWNIIEGNRFTFLPDIQLQYTQNAGQNKNLTYRYGVHEQHITLNTLLITEMNAWIQRTFPAATILMMATRNVLNHKSNKYSSVRTTPSAAINKIQLCWPLAGLTLGRGLDWHIIWTESQFRGLTCS